MTYKLISSKQISCQQPNGVSKLNDPFVVDNDNSARKSLLPVPSSSSSLSLQSSSLSLSSSHSIPLNSLNQLRMHEERAVPKNVTAQAGHPVYLHCIVEPIGDKMVSWIRLRDFHLLTVGLLTYISDDRFVIRHGTLQSNDWALQIKHVVPTDEGLYECQINSDPPRSQYYNLQVVVPVAEMIGQPDVFVRTGATINLTCVISRSPETPAYVFWYHNQRMINYDSVGRGDITIQKDSSKSDSVVSRLVIRSAKLHDSGNYTCAASNAQPTSLYVHVLQGEKRLSSRIQNDQPFIDQTSSDASAGRTRSQPNTQLRPTIIAITMFSLLMAAFNTMQSLPYTTATNLVRHT
ncbi:cell adhesion molecule 1-like [Oppia nitens]|uniref:cell adhesion molecule 1-like n=1 Tax=Oppia nitens TaxID=1686743 RepID=UPI0023DA25F8|nr:cell adhesion molecule 1-like [Oppia nitens]